MVAKGRRCSETHREDWSAPSRGLWRQGRWRSRFRPQGEKANSSSFYRERSPGNVAYSKVGVRWGYFVDIDPAVLEPAPSFLAVAELIWDDPPARQSIVEAWRAATKTLTAPGAKWKHVRGPVGAAMRSLLRIGAAWRKPFSIEVFGENVSLLEVPPKQVAELLKAQARQDIDRKFVEKIIKAEALETQDAAATRNLYKEGVDWELLRQILRHKRFDFSVGERDALHTLAVEKFWPGKRLWEAGLLGQSVLSGDRR